MALNDLSTEHCLSKSSKRYKKALNTFLSYIYVCVLPRLLKGKKNGRMLEKGVLQVNEGNVGWKLT